MRVLHGLAHSLLMREADHAAPLEAVRLRRDARIAATRAGAEGRELAATYLAGWTDVLDGWICPRCGSVERGSCGNEDGRCDACERAEVS